jgi:tetratricopeptide (TPR) repeat protein
MMKSRFLELSSLFFFSLLLTNSGFALGAGDNSDQSVVSEKNKSKSGKKQVSRKTSEDKTNSLFNQRAHSKMTDSVAKSTPFSSFVSMNDDDVDAVKAKELFSNAFKAQQEDRLADAIDAYKSVLNIRPESYEAFYNMAICLRERGRSEQAVKAFEHAAELHPYFKPVYKDLASMYTELGRKSDAESALATYNQL